MTAAVLPVASDLPRRRRRFGWPVWLVGLLLIGLFFSILVPTMCRARPVANRIKSAGNLRQIGTALTAYAHANGDRLPSDFAVLVRSADLTSDVFLSPSGTLYERPPGRTPEEWGRALVDRPDKFCSYRYVAAGLTLGALDEDALLAYEPVNDEDKSGLQLLHADGHVDWVQADPGSAARARYDTLLADAAAGKRPLEWRP